MVEALRKGEPGMHVRTFEDMKKLTRGGFAAAKRGEVA
jgi:hypothetical protein